MSEHKCKSNYSSLMNTWRCCDPHRFHDIFGVEPQPSLVASDAMGAFYSAGLYDYVKNQEWNAMNQCPCNNNVGCLKCPNGLCPPSSGGGNRRNNGMARHNNNGAGQRRNNNGMARHNNNGAGQRRNNNGMARRNNNGAGQRRNNNGAGQRRNNNGAGQRGKHLVVVGMSWCGYSKKQKEAMGQLKNDLAAHGFTVEYIDEKSNPGKAKELSKKHGITGYPTTVSDDTGGKHSGYSTDAKKIVENVKNSAKK